MNFSERLQTVLRNRKRHHPVPEVSVGRRAELHLEAMLTGRFEGTPYDYFAGLRVPHRGRRREIDFVVTLPDRLLVVELKNWSGFVGVDETGNVIQHRSGGRGVVDHGRLLSDLHTKQRALRNYLRRHLHDVPELWTALVFYDRRVGLDDRLVGTDEMSVVRLPEFLAQLPAPPDDDGLLARMFRAMFGRSDAERPKLPALTETVRQATDVLAKLGTWDLLVLHGGQIVSGDLADASTPELTDRVRFKQMRVDVPRSFFDPLRSQLQIEVMATDRDDEPHAFSYGFDETIQFHCAGDPRPKEFELRDVEAISLGYV